MSLFTCSFCVSHHDFSSFLKLFRHITTFHQNDSRFEITCNLNSTCGVSYRTYSAYKSHVYRHHLCLLHTLENKMNNLDTVSNDDKQQKDTDLDINCDLIYSEDDDEENLLNHYFELHSPRTDNPTTFDDTASLFTSTNKEKKDLVSMLDIKKSYVSFILQLREEYFLPKNTTNVISTYIITLMNQIQSLLEDKSFNYRSDNSLSTSTSQQTSIKVIELDVLKDTLTDICNAVNNITKNEYQFIKNCEKHFNYTPPEEIVISNPGDELEYAYYIPMDQTIL